MRSVHLPGEQSDRVERLGQIEQSLFFQQHRAVAQAHNLAAIRWNRTEVALDLIFDRAQGCCCAFEPPAVQIAVGQQQQQRRIGGHQIAGLFELGHGIDWLAIVQEQFAEIKAEFGEIAAIEQRDRLIKGADCAIIAGIAQDHAKIIRQQSRLITGSAQCDPILLGGAAVDPAGPEQIAE